MDHANIIQYADEKNPAKLQQAFAGAIGQKILSGIEAKKAEIGANLINRPVSTKPPITEGKQDYKIYHSSYSSCITEVENFVNKNGFILDPEEMFRVVATGPRKPSEGKTNSLHLQIYKSEKDLENEKPQRKAIHFQVFGMKTQYELNMYFG